ncbi:MAG: rod-binding protein [Acidobacteria bacterium]|nr:rod-binding protein [Acidobacteriota bacterium]
MINPIAQTNTLIGPDPTLLTKGEVPDKRRLKETAQQFESLLIGQIMHAMRESSGGGWMGTGEDQAGSTMGDFAEQHLAQIMTQQGGFGLASLIEQGLTRASEPATMPAQQTPSR